MTEFIASLMIEKREMWVSEKVEQEMHFKRCDMNYALELLRRGRGRRSDVKNKGRNSGQELERIIMMMMMIWACKMDKEG